MNSLQLISPSTRNQSVLEKERKSQLSRPLELPTDLALRSLQDAHDFNKTNECNHSLLTAPFSAAWFFQEPRKLAILPRRPSERVPSPQNVLATQDMLSEALMSQLSAGRQTNVATRQLLSIGGESGSGKSTFAARLGARFVSEGVRVLVLGTDGYMCTMGQIVEGCDADRIFDAAALLEDLQGLLSEPSQERTIPCFDYAVAGHNKLMRSYRGNDYDLIILEGLFAHSNSALAKLADVKVSIMVAAQTRLERCIQRCPEDAEMWTGVHTWLFANVSSRVAFAESQADWLLDAEAGQLRFLTAVPR